MLTFKEYLVESEGKNLASQTSYGKHLSEAATHMINNTKAYCKQHDIDFANSRFEISFKITHETNTEGKVRDVKGSKEEDPIIEKPEAKVEK